MFMLCYVMYVASLGAVAPFSERRRSAWIHGTPYSTVRACAAACAGRACHVGVVELEENAVRAGPRRGWGAEPADSREVTAPSSRPPCTLGAVVASTLTLSTPLQWRETSKKRDALSLARLSPLTLGRGIELEPVTIELGDPHSH